MNRVKSILLVGAVAFGITTTTASAETIRLAGFTWPGAIAIQNVITNVLKNRLGHDFEIVSVDQAAAMAAMCKGDGSIDVHVDLWMPNHQEKWNAYIAKGSKECVRVNDHPYVGVQGMFIPGYVQDKYGIKHVDDLSDPENAKLFDEDGDGKGEWWPGPVGWGSTNIGLIKAKSYGFDKNFDAVIVSQAAFKAKLKADYAKGKPVLFFYWTPEWLFAKYDLRQLEEPAFDGYAMASKKGDPSYKSDGCWDMYQPKEDPDWLEKSTVKCAFPDASIYVAYATSLEQKAPKAARFLKHIALNAEAISKWILEKEVDGREPEAVAKSWIESNQQTVDKWLEGTE